jgi:hypothetical protein
MGRTKRVAIYVRVSTDDQSTASQKAELQAWAERAGHHVVKVYEDHGISGAKGRDQRPAFDGMLKAGESDYSAILPICDRLFERLLGARRPSPISGGRCPLRPTTRGCKRPAAKR